MSNVRTQKRENYSIIANDCFNDTRLSYRAVGLLCYLLSKPNHWEAKTSQLVKAHREGRDAVYAAMKELCACGYVSVERGYRSFTYIVHESPSAENQETVFQEEENQESSFQDVLVMTDEEKGLSGERTDTTASAKPTDSPRPQSSRNTASRREGPSEREMMLARRGIARLVAEYPQHRVKAENGLMPAWFGVAKRPDIETLIADIRARRRSHDWTKDHGRWVPSIQRYIAEEMWEQTILPAPGTAPADDPHRGMTKLSEHVYIFGPPPGTE